MSPSVSNGIEIMDLHGKNAYQAQIAIDASLRRVRPDTYRLRLIHGYHGGSIIADLIATKYSAHPKVLRLMKIDNGTTDLVLREL